MAWTKSQIITVQTYRRYAKLSDCEYRGLLEEISDCRSSKDKGLTNYHFDHVMAHLEYKLDDRIAELVVPLPEGIKLGYWRGRLPQHGEPNSRHFHGLWQLWETLKPHLPAEQQTTAYLAGIASKACKYNVRDIYAAKAWQVALTIEALKDRLHHILIHEGHPTAVLPIVAPAVPAIDPQEQRQALDHTGAGSCLHDPAFALPF